MNQSVKSLTKSSVFLLGIAMLASCGGGSGSGDDTDPGDGSVDHSLNTHFFVGFTPESGEELWKSDGTEAGTTLVKEINPVGDSSPQEFFDVGTETFFTATNPLSGRELWKYDGVTTSMVKDINPTGDANPQNFVTANAKLYFTANDGIANNTLWESDGTSDGTIKVGSFSNVQNVTVTANNSIFFTTGSSLWIYDGVTVPSAISPAESISSPGQLTAVVNQLYFYAYTSAAGYELWTSDGTDLGTFLVLDIVSGAGSFFSPSYSRIFNVNGTLVMTEGSFSNQDIYVSNGTALGTVQLMTTDVIPQPVLSYRYSQVYQGNAGRVFFNSGSSQLWSTDGSAAGSELIDSQIYNYLYNVQVKTDGTYVIRTNYGLYTSDGTLAGTSRFLASNRTFAVVGNSIFYGSGTELMVTDGIDAGTPVIALPGNLALYGGTSNLYFPYSDGATGNEPWISDGTLVGTVLLADINLHPSGSSDPSNIVAFNHELYFLANEGDGQQFLWKSDGTEDGTVKISRDDFTSCRDLTVSGNTLYLLCSTDEYGRELWVSDGTAAGTELLIDLTPGENSSDIEAMYDVAGTLFFYDDDRGILWKTKGTADTTTVASTINPDDFDETVVANDKLYYVGYDSGDEELWVTDGTFSGTHLVKDINPNGDGLRNDLKAVALGDTVYFIADDGANGVELWKTDGTEANTEMVVNLNGAGDGLDRYDSALAVMGNEVYFTAYTIQGDLELWKTDGTIPGTTQITNFNNNGGYIEEQDDHAVLGNHLFFSADNGNDGLELWKTDGTTAGTVMVKNINPDNDSDPYGFEVKNNTLFFIADDGTNGEELWKSDGSEAGTVLVKDVYPGDGGGSSVLPLSNNNNN